MRKFIPIPGEAAEIGSSLCHWAAGKECVSILKSNSSGRSASQDPYSRFETCIAADALDQIAPDTNSFEALKAFHDKQKDWLFGFLSYDLKNEIEDLSSENFDGLNFPAIHFFQPRFIFLEQHGKWSAGFHPEHDTEETCMNAVRDALQTRSISMDDSGLAIQPRVERDQYIKDVASIQRHIQRGDIYEMNYCTEFYAQDAELNPFPVFEKLVEISPMPFSCYYRTRDLHLLCASPERFLAKRGPKIISQPIKGTIRRGADDEEDTRLKMLLLNDEKERSENVMIVDLVRNDLSRTARRNSVRVEELFGIYTFRQLHQMISTVVSDLREDLHWTEAIRLAFPMASMTGAPKIRAMELIEGHEETKRGLYSGTTGYITPEGDFDFNVVIRSILYNRLTKYLSFMVGSAITINSVPEKEYEECMLKAQAILTVLRKKTIEV